MKNFILTLNAEKFASAFYSFVEKVRGQNVLVNWFYTDRYNNNIPQEKDPRCYRESFKEWIGKCTPYLKPGGIAIDIGCFTGDSTLPMAHLVGNTGKVFAFDPNPITYREFLLNVAANPNLNIHSENVAIMEKEGVYEFLYQNNGENGGPAGQGLWTTETRCYPESVKLKAINLEEFLTRNGALDNIQLIKVDTEGYDCNILEINQNIIKRNKPAIIMEWLPGHEQRISRLLDILEYNSYNAETHLEIKIAPENRVHDLLLLPK